VIPKRGHGWGALVERDRNPGRGMIFSGLSRLEEEPHARRPA
jgi:hypothetical protein